LFKVKVISLPQSTIDQVLGDSLLQQIISDSSGGVREKMSKPKDGGNEKSKDTVPSQVSEKQTEVIKAAILKKQLEQGKLKQAQQQQANLIDSITASIITKSLKLCCNTQTSNPITVSPLQSKLVKQSTLVINPNKFRELNSLNTLILLLVMIGGFLGSLIHITGSFGDFIGNGRFKRSWSMWYFTRPFLAAGLAIVVYFAVIGGFLSLNSTSGSVNLVGVMTVSILVGLFTDRIALKLSEVFDVIFKPKDVRTDPITGQPKATLVTPMTIVRDTLVPITIMGENFVKEHLILTINGNNVDMIVTPNSIMVNYQVPVDPALQSILLTLKSDNGTILIEKQLTITA
jgi:hypothetical protein